MNVTDIMFTGAMLVVQSLNLERGPGLWVVLRLEGIFQCFEELCHNRGELLPLHISNYFFGGDLRSATVGKIIDHNRLLTWSRSMAKLINAVMNGAFLE